MPLGLREWKGGLFSDGTHQGASQAPLDGDSRPGTYGPFIVWPVFALDIIPNTDNVRNQLIWGVAVTLDSGGIGEPPPDPSFQFGFDWVWWDCARFHIVYGNNVGYEEYLPGSFPANSNVMRSMTDASTFWLRWTLVASGTNDLIAYSVAWRIGFRPLV